MGGQRFFPVIGQYWKREKGEWVKGRENGGLGCFES